MSPPSIPVVRTVAPQIPAAERDRLLDLAARLLRDEPALATTNTFGNVVADLAPGPKLLIGDQSEIPLLSTPGACRLGYRIALIAGEGDTVLLGHERSPVYERYLADLLGIGRFEVMTLRDQIADDPAPLAQRCLERPAVLEKIVRQARSAGCLSVVPHIATGNAWRLAGEIARRAGTEVAVCGAPPRLTRCVNDKLWFAERVREVLGHAAAPPYLAAYGPASLAGRVARLARQWERIVVKVPDSAGSAGNLTLESTRLRGRPVGTVHAMLRGVMASRGWGERYPLKVEVWDCNVLASPSVQIWIPQTSRGDPVVEGLFEQSVAGDEGMFVGARRAELPGPWLHRLASEAVRLAILLQAVGYFGRCSLDCVIYGSDFPSAALHWIECNGRWGGVSLPMTLAHRLLDDPASHGLAIIQHEDRSLTPRPFQAALDMLDDLLFRPRARSDGVIPLTPTGIERGSGIHLMAIAKRGDRARDLAEEAARRLSARRGNDLPA